MTKPSVLAIALVGFILADVASADEIEKLRLEVQQLRQSIDAPVQPWLESQGLRLDLSMQPLRDFIAVVATSSVASRTLKLDLTSQAGQLLGWDDDCYFWGVHTGSKAAYAEFFNVAGGRAYFTLNGLVSNWSPNGLALSGSVHYDSFIPMIKTVLDLTCAGGGLEGPSFGPTACVGDRSFSTQGSVRSGTTNLLGYSLAVDSSNDIHCSTSLGAVGTLNFAFPISLKQDLSGEIGGGFVRSGTLDFQVAGARVSRPYTLDLSGISLSSTNQGVTVRGNVALQWK